MTPSPALFPLLCAPAPVLALPAVVPARLPLDTVVVSDALAFLRGLPSESVDAVITDPPYGIGYESSWTTRIDGSRRTTPTSFGKDKLDVSWITECCRVLKNGGAMYLFTRWDVAHYFRDAIEAAGLKVAQRIVWHKAHWKMGDLRYYGSQTEDILFARKGDHSLRWAKREGNVWYSADALYQGDGYWGHPTQKPIKILEKPILYSTDPGGVICDPFLGSGTTAVAAKRLDRHYIGCDLNPAYVALARERLRLPFEAHHITRNETLDDLPLFAGMEPR